MQPQIVVIFMDHEENLRSEFIDLHLTSMNSEITGKYHSNSIILS